jgi:two-component system, OmpR family, sensor histidine kinase TctE
MRTWVRSLEGGLAIRLGVLYLLATAFAVAALLYQAYDTASTLNDRDLNLRAADLARYVAPGSGQSAKLNLPRNLAAAYEMSSSDIFAVRSQEGRVIAASPAIFGEIVAAWPFPTDDANYFRLKDFGAQPQDYYGLSITLSSAKGPVAISVARASEGSLLAHSLLQEFIVDAAWVIPLLVIVTLVTGSYAIRGGLRPVREVSDMAATIGPGNTTVRLPEHNLPNELVPLVAAVNRALDRLAQGFAVQREFTANAAHELRTPLTIITAALDTIPGDDELTKLKTDVARMNRIVAQLLRVARLDAVGLDISGKVDLNTIAEGVVSATAPMALAQERSVAFFPSDPPVVVQGNANAIEDAIRNLVENAIAHTPRQSEVTVRVLPDGSVSVVDHGCGIALEDRPRIFQRFWRGKGVATGGAGLGLAIVKEIVDAHCGTIRIDDNPEGPGSIFTLHFPLRVDQAHRAAAIPAGASLAPTAFS